MNLYFETNRNARAAVRRNDTPAGSGADRDQLQRLRDIARVKMPFTWTVSQTYMQMTIKLSGVRPNVPVDAAIFAKPAPAAKR